MADSERSDVYSGADYTDCHTKEEGGGKEKRKRRDSKGQR